MPEDRFCTAVWNKLIVEEGGEAKLSETSNWIPDEMVDSYLKEKTDDEPPDDELPLGPGVLSGFDDSRGNVGALEFYEEVTKIFQRLPKIAEVYTKAEVAVVLQQTGRTAGDGPHGALWGLDQQLDNLYWQINESAKEKINGMMMRQLGHYDRDRYEAISRTVFQAAYRMVGLQKDVSLRQVKNIDTLRRIDLIIKNLGDEIPD